MLLHSWEKYIIILQPLLPLNEDFIIVITDIKISQLIQYLGWVTHFNPILSVCFCTFYTSFPFKLYAP